MHAATPPLAPALSTPAVTLRRPPSLPFAPSTTVSFCLSTLPPPSSDGATSPQGALRQLLQEWYSGLAELLLGEAAAADVLGYKDTLYLSACERTDVYAGEGSDEEAVEGGEGTFTGAATAELLPPSSSSSFPSLAQGGDRAALPHSPRFLLDVLHDTIVSGRHSGATEQLIACLTQLLPSLRTESPLPPPPPLLLTPPQGSIAFPTGVVPSLQQPRQQHTLATPYFHARGDEESSSNTNDPPLPLTSAPTAAPNLSSSMARATPIAVTAAVTTTSSMPWLYTLADALNAAMDFVDSLVDAVFFPVHLPASVPTTTTSCSSSLSPTQVLPSMGCSLDVLAREAAAATAEESCIMAGLLFSRHVRVRRGPAYATVTSPLLVVLDLDMTVLRQPLSSVTFRTVQTMSPREQHALFVDADFFCGFCEAVTRHGHKLAVCSLTEGAADQHWCGLSVAEVVLAVLALALPSARTYLCSPDDVVCMTKSMAGPGKLFHLQVLQQRYNTRGQSPSVVTAAVGGGSMRSFETNVGLDRSKQSVDISYSSHDVVDENVSPVVAAAPLLPRWLSTDVLLIDDDKENCRLAVAQGYHAAHCGESGLSTEWFAARPDVQVLLGVTTDEMSCEGAF